MFQHSYIIHRLHCNHAVFKMIDFTDYNATLYVQSLFTAKLVVIQPNKILNGTLSLPRIIPFSSQFPLRLSSVEYSQQIILDDQIIGERLKHDFHGVVTMTKYFELKSVDAPLFKKFELESTGTIGIRFDA